jgi:hypothetical protein
MMIGACSEIEYEDQESGEVSFYSASDKLDAAMRSADRGQMILMPLTPDDNQTEPLPGSNMIPFFERGRSVEIVRDFPAVNTSNTTPWTVFGNYRTGNYLAGVYVNSMGSEPVFSFRVHPEKDQRRTYFLSDSAGVFHDTEVAYQKGTEPDKIRFRFIQLCPDADSVNVRINTVGQKGSLQNMTSLCFIL